MMAYYLGLKKDEPKRLGHSLSNLLVETEKELSSLGHTPADVLWVGTDKRAGTWEEFAAIAADVNYDTGYGATYVNERLLVVGDGWWLERAEYDGSEWWEYQAPPEHPECRELRLTDLVDEYYLTHWEHSDE